MLYLMNSPILTEYGDWRFEGPLSVEAARQHVEAAPFTSSIGHESAARFLSQLLGLEIPVNRVAITMQAGDRALVLRILTRLPEGAVLDNAAMHAIPYNLSLLTRLT